MPNSLHQSVSADSLGKSISNAQLSRVVNQATICITVISIDSKLQTGELFGEFCKRYMNKPSSIKRFIILLTGFLKEHYTDLDKALSEEAKKAKCKGFDVAWLQANKENLDILRKNFNVEILYWNDLRVSPEFKNCLSVIEKLYQEDQGGIKRSIKAESEQYVIRVLNKKLWCNESIKIDIHRLLNYQLLEEIKKDLCDPFGRKAKTTRQSQYMNCLGPNSALREVLDAGEVSNLLLNKAAATKVKEALVQATKNNLEIDPRMSIVEIITLLEKRESLPVFCKALKQTLKDGLVIWTEHHAIHLKSIRTNNLLARQAQKKAKLVQKASCDEANDILSFIEKATTLLRNFEEADDFLAMVCLLDQTRKLLQSEELISEELQRLICYLDTEAKIAHTNSLAACQELGKSEYFESVLKVAQDDLRQATISDEQRDELMTRTLKYFKDEENKEGLESLIVKLPEEKTKELLNTAILMIPQLSKSGLEPLIREENINLCLILDAFQKLVKASVNYLKEEAAMVLALAIRWKDKKFITYPGAIIPVVKATLTKGLEALAIKDENSLPWVPYSLSKPLESNSEARFTQQMLEVEFSALRKEVFNSFKNSSAQESATLSKAVIAMQSMFQYIINNGNKHKHNKQQESF